MILNTHNRSRHTIELSYLQDDEDFNLFSFDYPFYDDNLKKQFEIKFMDYYRYCEIGFESVERFQRALCTRLHTIMPFYKQQYDAFLIGMKSNFMFNKDLKETFIREYNNEDNSNSNTLDKSSSESSSNNDTNATHKESVLNNINANIGDDKLTGMTSDKTLDISKALAKALGSSEMNSTGKQTGKETTTLISQGNIGITSSGQLLEDYWRVTRNFDLEIIEECWDLFSLL
mgnify:CR=1 FL=1